MNLYLVQHAEPKPKEEDPQRPLSDRGQAGIERVAAFVAGHISINVDRILHSGKTRARQTAEVLARHLNPPGQVAATESLEPLADPSIWAGRVAEEKAGLMLVGHLPHLDKLAAKLVSGDEAKSVIVFQMGGIVCVAQDDSGDWRVRWMVIPQMLK